MGKHIGSAACSLLLQQLLLITVARLHCEISTSVRFFALLQQQSEGMTGDVQALSSTCYQDVHLTVAVACSNLLHEEAPIAVATYTQQHGFMHTY